MVRFCFFGTTHHRNMEQYISTIQQPGPQLSHFIVFKMASLTLIMCDAEGHFVSVPLLSTVGDALLRACGRERLRRSLLGTWYTNTSIIHTVHVGPLVCLHVCLSASLSTCLSFCLHVGHSVLASTCVSVHRLSACLSVSACVRVCVRAFCPRPNFKYSPN